MNGSRSKIRQHKRLGQIFLKDENTLKQIVTLADEKENDFILEIGSGSGVLTEKLLELNKPVLAVEIDPGWAAILKKKFASNKNFTLIVGDILKLNFKEILPKHKKTCLVGNLPYQISTPLFFLLIHNRQLFEYFVFMFQKEFAMRIVTKKNSTDKNSIDKNSIDKNSIDKNSIDKNSIDKNSIDKNSTNKKKSTKNFSSLTVLGELFFCLEKILEVPKEFFYPVPKVDSTILKMRKNNFEMKNKKEFFVFLQCLFQQPRKTLFNNLKRTYPNILEVLTEKSESHFAKLRPAELNSKQILELFYFLEKTK